MNWILVLNQPQIICADETQVNIAKHVLKTLCVDVTNILVNFLAADLMMSVENPSTITNEVCAFRINQQWKTINLVSIWKWIDVLPQVRVKILGKLSEETRGPLMKLHNCLNGKVSSISVTPWKQRAPQQVHKGQSKLERRKTSKPSSQKHWIH